ncbi:MAG TPA: NAD-dependent epimerase/dehydratase family protein [Pirellulales bacterium]|nr:NAD-dependent epimerase/dehydratase family protein [Pirellulales bacterium]
MKVLVTGATGFIGGHLLPLLRDCGATIRAMIVPGEDDARLRTLGIEVMVGDVRSDESLQAAVEGVDAVFHLAGLLAARNLRQLLEINEVGTSKVAQACANRTTPPVLLLVSSLAAAGPAPKGGPRTETDPPRPVSNYGHSKRAGELAAMRWAGRIPLTVVRPPMVFGEGDLNSRWLFLPIARTGIHAVPGLQARSVSLIHVDDMCRALCLAAQRGERVEQDDDGTAKGVYFLASENDLDYGELGQMMGAAVGRSRVRVVHAPGWLGYCAASAGELASRVFRRPTLFNVDKMREALAGDWTCSPARSERELGFSVARTLPERFAQTAQWYIDRGLL